MSQTITSTVNVTVCQCAPTAGIPLSKQVVIINNSWCWLSRWKE